MMKSLDKPGTFNIKRIAIIGAGPCGLSAAKYLRAEETFEEIVIFEQRDEVGGIWNYSELAPESCCVPQRDPLFPADEPVQPKDVNRPPVFLSPLYEQLHTNIPKSVMAFSDQEFPDDEQVYPSREAVQRYLLKYAEDVRGVIRFCQRVKSVILNPRDGYDKWDFEIQSTVNGEITKDTFDAVVVANGHYAVPHIPEIPKMKEFQEAYPMVIQHSKQYRCVDSYRNKRVVIVGNGPSGSDIARQISQVCAGKPILSVRYPTFLERLAHANCEEYPEIGEFLVQQRGVRFKDRRIVSNVDVVLFCTGFLYSLPFLPDLRSELISTGAGVRRLYKHIFCIQHATLVFPGLNMKAAPWPVSEAQAAVIAAIWSNYLLLPTTEEMVSWSRKLEEEQGDALHHFPPLGDADYVNELHDRVMMAAKVGKEPPQWDARMMWERDVYISAKLAFEKQGCRATSLEELGFRYAPVSKE